ncbi:phospholipase SGR2-like isoform X2 [Pistacia vera]|uniref:phospholipase SGR2-like isoform X2 n=1 Tax=Pistacia vera TaxID=55513 RepID=UPI001263A1CD|nr:phospholipase SGR2-like isoform X2 [Pistacia vera]
MLDDEPKSYTPYIKYPKLEFKVHTFFAVGSHLGVFLALRNVHIGIGKGQDYMDEENIIEEMLVCRQMFNIFHPYDPVAYRVEPLVCKEFLTVCPVIIPYHRGGKRLHIWVPVAENAEEREERSYGVIMMKRLTGSAEGRVDHMLQKLLEGLRHHPFHIETLVSRYTRRPASSSKGNSKTGSASIGWSDQRETVEEELPLTFSDRMMDRTPSLPLIFIAGEESTCGLYRGFLRAAGSKSPEDRHQIESIVSTRFRQNSKQVNRKNFIYIEYFTVVKNNLSNSSPDTVRLSSLIFLAFFFFLYFILF